MTVELGIEMISFLIVLIRVTNNDFSITSPTTSPIYRSPILNKRIYVSIKPAIFEVIPDPNVTGNPEKQKRLEIQENHLEDRKNYNNHKSEYNYSNNLIGGISPIWIKPGSSSFFQFRF
jgi:hypothetical protein